MPVPSQPTWQQVQAKFQQIWGYADFRSPQGEIVQCLLAKQDAIVVMPTGVKNSQNPAVFDVYKQN